MYFEAVGKECECAVRLSSDLLAVVRNLKVILVEDSAAVRERVAELLEQIDGVELIGEYEDAKTAVDSIRDDVPDVVLLDIKLRGSNGMEVMRYINKSKANLRVIVLTNYAESQYRDLFLREGAHAVLDKSNEFHRVEELLQQMIGAL
jgi:DNA-binding NarL/FixJ family response regulator